VKPERPAVVPTRRLAGTAAASFVAALALAWTSVSAAATPSAPALPAQPAPPTPPIPHPPPALTRSAHVPFENCSAKNVTLTVSLPERSFAQPSVTKMPVTYQVMLHNAGDTPCGRPVPGLSLSRSLYVGPCGALSSVVYNAIGANVYPGAAVFACPASNAVYLPAHGTLASTGRWTGYEYLARSPGTAAQLRPAPPGAYHLVIGSVGVGAATARPVILAFTLVSPSS
jgi:hypothetical protein